MSLPNITTIKTNGISGMLSGCTNVEIDFSGRTTVTNPAFAQIFRNHIEITRVNLHDLMTISGSGSFLYAFAGCTNLTSIDLSNLTESGGNMGLMLSGCTSLTSLDLSKMESAYDIHSMCDGCTSLKTVYLTKLSTTPSESSYTAKAFQNCSALELVDFS